MKYLTTLFFLFFASLSTAQSGYHLESSSQFEGTRGNTDTELILSLPQQELVQLQNHLNTTSGFGWTFNYFGNVLVVEQLDVLYDGTKQLLLRREDGKDFFGHQRTIKAVLKVIEDEQAIASTVPQ